MDQGHIFKGCQDTAKARVEKQYMLTKQELCLFI